MALNVTLVAPLAEEVYTTLEPGLDTRWMPFADTSLGRSDGNVANSTSASLSSADGEWNKLNDEGFDLRETSESDLICAYYTFVTGVVLSVPIALLGLVGNLAACVAMWKERHTSSICLLLIALAFADTGILLTWTITNAVAPFCVVWGWCSALINAGPYLFSYGLAVGSLSHLTSIYIVVLVALQRLAAVLRPTHAATLNAIPNTRVQLASVVLMTSIFCAPRFAERYVGTDAISGHSVVVTRAFALSYGYRVVYKIILYNIVYFGIPFLVLFVVSYKLMTHLRAASKLRSTMTSLIRKEHDTTKTLVMVVVVFLVTQAVNPVRRVLIEVLSADQKLCGSAFYFIHHLTPLCVLINSSCNFIIYCACSQRFRRRVRHFCAPARVAPAPIQGQMPVVELERPPPLQLPISGK